MAVNACRLNSQFRGTAHDAASDFTAIGGEQLAKGRRWKALGVARCRSRDAFIGSVKCVKPNGGPRIPILRLLLLREMRTHCQGKTR